MTEFWRTDGSDGLLDGLIVPDSVMDDIMANPSYSTEEEKKIAGLQYYLQTLPGASWEDIAGTLWFMEEHTALEEVRQYLPSAHGERLGEFPSTLYFGRLGLHINGVWPVFLLKQLKLVANYVMTPTSGGVVSLRVSIKASQFLATSAFFLARI